VERKQPLLHRLGDAGAKFGTKPPRSKGVRLALQVGLAVVVFGFLVLTVIDQWSEIQNEGVHFHVLWLIPGLIILVLYFVLSAFGWDLVLRSLGYRIGFGRAQVAWGQPLLARYVPGSILYVLGRVLLSERAGVPRRISVASIVYEQAISATSAIVVAAYFIIKHPDLQSVPERWAVLLLIPLAVFILHPTVFGKLSSKALRALGRDPLPVVMSLRDVVALIVYYSLVWLAVAFGIYAVARSVTYIPYSDILLVGSAQAIGYFAALVTLVAPAGLGVRDAAFAWAVKAALPSRSFAVGSLISIAVRGAMTVGELIYVALVTTVGRRQGWTIHTGILHPSAEEAEASTEETTAVHTPEIL
jgi:glycosyltransferase 2 family protein